jgi:hypothetical protein
MPRHGFIGTLPIFPAGNRHSIAPTLQLCLKPLRARAVYRKGDRLRERPRGVLIAGLMMAFTAPASTGRVTPGRSFNASLGASIAVPCITGLRDICMKLFCCNRGLAKPFRFSPQSTTNTITCSHP